MLAPPLRRHLGNPTPQQCRDYCATTRQIHSEAAHHNPLARACSLVAVAAFGLVAAAAFGLERLARRVAAAFGLQRRVVAARWRLVDSGLALQHQALALQHQALA